MTNNPTHAALISATPQRPNAEALLVLIDNNAGLVERLLDTARHKPSAVPHSTAPLRTIRDAIRDNRKLLARLLDPAEAQSIATMARQVLTGTTESVVKRQIGLLLGAYPNAAPSHAEAYVTQLLFDILSIGVADAVTLLACRELRRTQTFLPTIAEFLSMAQRTDRARDRRRVAATVSDDRAD